MLSVILLTIAGLLLESGAAYCLYRLIARQIPALLYRVLLAWVFLQVLNTLAALTTWFVFQENFSLLLFYVLLAVLCIPFALWAFLGTHKDRIPLPANEPLTGNQKAFLISFGILFLVLFLSTARHGFMPQWGNVDMANQVNAINAFHAKILPNWNYARPHVVQAAPVLWEATTMWGYIFGYNFLTALVSRLTFIETIYVLNITTCFNTALWLSAPLLLTEWKRTRVWTVLYWILILFTVREWYSAVERGWLTSIYSLGQCVIVLASLFYMKSLGEKRGALFYVGIGIGSFMVANAHPYNYPIFFISVVLMALFSGERRFGRKILRALLYGAISAFSLLPLWMQSEFKSVFSEIFGFLFSGDFAGLLTIRNFEMITSARAPVWIGIIAMLGGVTAVLLIVRTVKKSYIVGISAVVTVVALYAVYGSNGYLYQKEFILTPPIYFLLALHLIHDLWQLVHDKWIAGRTKIDTGQWQVYVLAPVLIAAMLLTGQIDLGGGIARAQDRVIDARPMVEAPYYQAAVFTADRIREQKGRGLVNFRTVNGAQKMFLSRIAREDDLAQLIPGLDYYAVEPTSYEALIQYVDMAREEHREDWETGMYLVHDAIEREWPGFSALSTLMAEVEPVYQSGDLAVTRMRLRADVRSSYIPLAGGVVPVHIERSNVRTRYIESFGQGTMAETTGAPAVMGMDNPLSGTAGDLMFLFRGSVSEPGRVTLAIKGADGRQSAHAVLPAFGGLTAVVVPAEELGEGAAGFEIVMEPGNVPASAVLQWMRVYVIPDGE